MMLRIGIVMALIIGCSSLALPGTTPRQCYCVCADGKKCIIAPGEMVFLQIPKNCFLSGGADLDNKHCRYFSFKS